MLIYFHQFVAGDFSFPLDIGEKEFFEDWICNSKDFLRSVTSNCNSVKSLSTAQVVRGIPEERLRRFVHKNKKAFQSEGEKWSVNQEYYKAMADFMSWTILSQILHLRNLFIQSIGSC